jgi:PadR family transcriptional regulator, regulatory protein AphA
MSTIALTPTSYVVLGLLARDGPSTPYDLKRLVAATIGHFWTFPHTLLYTEPARLATLGLVVERREQGGRHRRVFSITGAGRRALDTWLGQPMTDPIELRDPGLLQLFFAEADHDPARKAIATRQLEVHKARLSEYQADQRAETANLRSRSAPRTNTMERWRGETLTMGVLYERAAVAFWESVLRGPRYRSAAGNRAACRGTR